MSQDQISAPPAVPLEQASIDQGRSVTFKAPRTESSSSSQENFKTPDGSNGHVAKDEKVPPKSVDIDEHLLSLDDVAQRYQVSFNKDKPVDSKGLSDTEAKKRLEENGPNILSPPKRRHPILKFFDCLFSPFNLLLLISAALCYILYGTDREANSQQVIVGSILLGVALINALIDFVQQQKSQAILESFLNMIPAKAFAIRDGKLQNLPAVELVNGDIVYVRMGDKVPADVLVIASTELKVDNSSLTGESEPQERSKTNAHENPLEATNLIFNGTLVVNGDAYGIVIRTGDRTVLGQIAGLTAGEEKRDSPMSIEIKSYILKISIVAFICALVFFVVALEKNSGDNRVAQAITLAIGTFVSFVPEGLPATLTVLLTIAAQRMAGRNVLVKDLQGVETLGAITLLATDKTGTLTRNQMTVTYIWTGWKMFFALSSGNSGNQDETIDKLDNAAPGVDELIHMSALCAKAKFDRTDVPIEQRQILGDATESGLIKFAASKVENFDALQDQYPKVFEIPFNSENKWHLTIHKKKHANGGLTLYIKGAPERILRLCDKVFYEGQVLPLTDEHRNKFNETYKFMASKGHRVLAFANLFLDGAAFPDNFEFSKDPINYPKDGYIFHALVSLEDPPKHGVREAIGHCREAGIKVMMVTGDHPLTAEAIGRKINLMLQDTKQMVAEKTGRPIEEIGEDEYNAIVIHGERIDSLTDEDWENIFTKEEIIFARTSPKHKLQIVKRAQARGHIVGVTGDGVNDSPALKKADLGIAMNQSGSDVSKEAAAMILLDDNFASTVNGIEEGRLIFTNLKKSIQYTVSHTMPEVWANLLFIAVPIPLPLSTLLIIIIDLGFELCIALSYAWDPPENRTGLMKLPPRKPVTEQSVERLRRKQADMRQPVVDSESGQVIPLTWSQKVGDAFRSCTKIFTKKYWVEALEETDDEVLIDGNLLSFSYLEIGTIQAVGCLVAYFVAMYYSHGVTPTDAFNAAKNTEQNWLTEDTKSDFVLGDGTVLNIEDQKDAIRQGNSMYFLSIMFMQCFNVFICKARMGYPFGKVMFRNWRTFAGMFGGACIAMFFVYVPPLNNAFTTSYKTSPLLWLIPIAFGILMLGYASLRIWVLRKSRPIKFSKEVIGLQMFPTRWSTKNSANR